MKGETPTYSAVYRDAKTGEPYKIPVNFQNPVVKFTVRDSVYDIDNARFVYNLNWDARITVKGGGHRLDDKIATYNLPDPITSYDWDDNYFGTYTTASKTALYRKLNANGEYDYAYFGDDDKWHEYSFRLVFEFDYIHTSKLEPKTYYYEIALFADVPTDDGSKRYKMPILAPTEFIVGGTLSE